MSVFLRKNSPFYYAEFFIKGHRVLRSTQKRTEREARAKEREFRAEKAAELAAIAAAAPSDQLTLDQCFGRYLKRELPDLSLTWQAEVVRYGQVILSIVDPNMLMEDVTDAEVDQFVTAHKEAGGGKYALNRALSIWRRVHRLSKSKWKQKCQIIDWSEHRHVENKRIADLSHEQATTLIASAAPNVAEMIEWSILTGTRRQETFKLTRDNIDLQEGKATVMAKGGKKHTVWLNADAMALLARIPHRGRYVFDTTGWSKRWKAATAKAGLDGFRWHDLRHVHATWLRRSGAPLEVVQRSLGHADLETTTRYAHVDDKELKAALHKLPSFGISGEGKVVSIRKGRK
jgi:site-specific recombinase XerD